jgi:hypothetical protein
MNMASISKNGLGQSGQIQIGAVILVCVPGVPCGGYL